MIKCTLIEVDNDNRAIIGTGGANVGDTDGKVSRTKPLTWINYVVRQFGAGGKLYQFDTPDEAV